MSTSESAFGIIDNTNWKSVHIDDNNFDFIGVREVTWLDTEILLAGLVVWWEL